MQQERGAAVSAGSGPELTLIAGFAGEAGVTLAFVGSNAVSVLTAGLTQSYPGRIQRGRDRSVLCTGRRLAQSSG